MPHHLLRSAALAAVLCLPAQALAGSIAGNVQDQAGAPLAGMEVRLWAHSEEAKGKRIAHALVTEADGLFRFEEVAVGTYLLDARMAPGVVAGVADRWYDVSEPWADGWIEAAADPIEVTGASAIEDLTLTLLPAGGLDGRVLVEGAARAGMLVRAEAVQSCRYHHGDQSWASQEGVSDEFVGVFMMRGLRPVSYRLVLYDPAGLAGTSWVAGPFQVAVGEVLALGDLALPVPAADPYEPNDGPWEEGAGSVDEAVLRAAPGQPWVSAGARIAPRGSGDTDWYCFDVRPEDRFGFEAAAPRGPAAPCAVHPWLDPVVSFWAATDPDAPPVLLLEDDDSLGDRDAFVDTGELLEPGRHCVAVSMYGDRDWIGRDQHVGGEYSLRVYLGNRRPHLSVRLGDGDAPPIVDLEEGEELCLDLEYSDPDGEPPRLLVSHLDQAATPVADGRLEELGPGQARYCWTADQRAAEGSPYQLDVSATDGEYAAKRAVVVRVAAVNVPPAAPEPVAPEDGAVLAGARVRLVVETPPDADGDPLKLEFELRLAGDALPIVGREPEGDDGLTAWTTPVLADDTTACWRARAYDDHDNGHSLWSEQRCFAVDTVNTPPAAPVLTKPAENGQVLVRRPLLAALNPTDPDDLVVHVVFELSEDEAFAGAWRGRVRQGRRSLTTTWRAEADLDWGGTYFARAYAEDERGQTSPYSAVHPFSVKDNVAPGVVELSPDGLFEPACEGQVFTDARPGSVLVAPVLDPEQEAVTLEVRIVELDADGAEGAVLVDVAVPAAPEGAPTEVSFDPSLLEEDGHYLLAVRAADGTDATAWRRCELWIDLENSPPGPLRILEPEPGLTLPEGQELFTVKVDNGTDAELGIPGRTLELAWCAARALELVRCESDPAEWARLPFWWALDHTEFGVSGGGPGETWHVRVCAIDEHDVCGPQASTFVDFWDNRPPGPVRIVTPPPGTEVPPTHDLIRIEVTNTSDPDLGRPGTSVELAVCATQRPDKRDCGEDSRAWERVRMTSYDPADTTGFFVRGRPGQTWWVPVCAIDERGLCGPGDETWFTFLEPAGPPSDPDAGGPDGGGGLVGPDAGVGPDAYYEASPAPAQAAADDGCDCRIGAGAGPSLFQMCFILIHLSLLVSRRRPW